MTLFWICFASVTLALSFLLGVPSDFISLHLRFIVGLTCFGIAPGVLIYLQLQRSGQSTSGGVLERILSIVSLSFSFNLLFNIILFLSGTSFHNITIAMLGLMFAGYLTTYFLHRSDPKTFFSPLGEVASNEEKLGWLLVVLCIFLSPLYFRGAPPVNLEELVTLRKLFENPHIYFDNLSFNNGDPTTYLLTPFLVMIVGVSTIASIDVALTYSLFWFVTSILSFMCFIEVLRFLAPRREVLWSAALIFLVIVIYYPNSTIYEAGILNSYPNRYGFAGGVLLPLNILIFLAVLRESKANLRLNFLLIYLTIEMTFVHARETLFVLGFFVLTAVMLLPSGRIYAKSLRRISYILVMTVVILYAYKSINLKLGQGLGAYVGELQQLSGEAASKLIGEKGFFRALVTQGPDKIVHGANQAASVVVQIVRFEDVFVRSWSVKKDLGRIFLPLSMVALPFYLFFATSLLELAAGAVLVVTALLMGSGLLQLWVSRVIGNPEVWSSYNIVFLFSLTVLVVSIGKIGRFAGATCEKFLGPKKWFAFAALLVACVAIASGAPILFRWVSAFPVEHLVAIFMSLAAAGLLVIVYKLWRQSSRLPMLNEFIVSGQMQGSRSIAAATAMLAVSLVWGLVANSNGTLKAHFGALKDYPEFTGSLLKDFPKLVSTQRLDPVIYPESVLKFLREEVKPNSRVLAPDSVKLATLTPHFFAVAMDDHVVYPGFIINARFLNDFPLDENRKFSWSVLFASDVIADKLFKAYEPEYLILSEAESTSLDQLPENSLARKALQPVFRSEGFAVFKSSFRISTNE